MNHPELSRSLDTVSEKAPRQLRDLTDRQEALLFAYARGEDQPTAAAAREALCIFSVPTIESALAPHRKSLGQGSYEDVCQESLIAVAEKLIDKHDTSKGSFSSFVMVASKRRALSELRYQQAKGTVSLDTMMEADSDLDGQGTVSFVEQLADPQDVEREVVSRNTPPLDVSPLFRNLRESHRRYIALSYLSKRPVTVEEKARLLGLNESAVKGLGHRAHRSLREIPALRMIVRNEDFARPDGSAIVSQRRIAEVLGRAA